MVLYAHNYPGFPKQPLDEHLLNVASQAEVYGKQFNMGATAHLVAILHDMGKASQNFQKYRLGLGLLPGERTHKGWFQRMHLSLDLFPVSVLKRI